MNRKQINTKYVKIKSKKQKMYNIILSAKLEAINKSLNRQPHNGSNSVYILLGMMKQNLHQPVPKGQIMVFTGEYYNQCTMCSTGFT